MMIPANLKLSRLILTPASLPGSGRFWLVYERLDAGDVCHIRYLGLLPAREGETTEAMVSRAAAHFEGRQE